MASRSGSFAEPAIERSQISGSGASRRAALLQHKSPSGAPSGPFLAYRIFLRGAVPFISGQLQFATSFLMLSQALPPVSQPLLPSYLQKLSMTISPEARRVKDGPKHTALILSQQHGERWPFIQASSKLPHPSPCSTRPRPS